MGVRRFLPLLLLVALGGCFADQKSELAACESRTAQRNLPQGRSFKSTLACMDKAGYRFIGWNDGVACNIGAVVKGQPLNGDALCFEPKGWLALRLYRVEVPLRRARGAST